MYRKLVRVLERAVPAQRWLTPSEEALYRDDPSLLVGKRVQVLSRKGTPIQVVTTAVDGAPFGQLAGVAVSGSRLFVSDYDHDCVHELACLPWAQARTDLEAAMSQLTAGLPWAQKAMSELTVGPSFVGFPWAHRA